MSQIQESDYEDEVDIRNESIFTRPVNDGSAITPTDLKQAKSVTAPPIAEMTPEDPVSLQDWVDSEIEKELALVLRYNTPHFCVRGYNYSCRGLLCRMADAHYRGRGQGFAGMLQPHLYAAVADYLERNPDIANIAAQPRRSRSQSK